MNFKKIGKIFTSKFVGTGPLVLRRKNLPGRGLTKVEKHWSRPVMCNPRSSGIAWPATVFKLT